MSSNPPASCGGWYNGDDGNAPAAMILSFLSAHAQISTFLAAHRQLKSAPGKDFNYSNDGYNLLATLMEVVSGVSFEKFVRQEILAPAGLSETGFWGEPISNGGPIASVMKKINTTPNWGFRGATGMFSTTGDLYRWTRALLDYRVLSKDDTERVFKSYVTTSRGGYGYGWFSSKTKNGVSDLWTAGYEDLGHNGSSMCTERE